jgi:hypothetical protein
VDPERVMPNERDLKRLVNQRKTAPINDLVRAINVSLDLADHEDSTASALQAKAETRRLDAALMLAALRLRKGKSFWPFALARFKRSRGDLEKLLAVGLANDPEAAEAEARERNRAHQAAYRAKGREARLLSGNQAVRVINPVIVREPRPKPSAAGYSICDAVSEYELNRILKFIHANRPDEFARRFRDQRRVTALNFARDVKLWASQLENALAEDATGDTGVVVPFSRNSDQPDDAA